MCVCVCPISFGENFAQTLFCVQEKNGPKNLKRPRLSLVPKLKEFQTKIQDIPIHLPPTRIQMAQWKGPYLGAPPICQKGIFPFEMTNSLELEATKKCPKYLKDYKCRVWHIHHPTQDLTVAIFRHSMA